MKIHERIKNLRKEYLNLNQEEFASRINISRGNLSNIEINRVNVTNRVISDICSSFNINEDWLRHGQGEMFEKIPEEDEFFKAATELSKNNDKMAMQAVIEYWKLDDESKKLLKNYILKVAENSKE